MTARPATRNPLVVALDTGDLDRLAHLAALLGPHAGVLKVGLEAFAAHGARAIAAAAAHAPVFCDLKLHDIPNTVAGAAAAAAGHGVALLTVHASGGPAMVRAAVDAAPGVTILAVTVLTSLSADDLRAVGQDEAAVQVPRLAAMAVEAGAGGIVCAPGEVRVVREAVGDDVLVVTPGVRPRAAAPVTGPGGADDQARVATPAEAVRAGADLVVVGRPVTRADDPAATARAIVAEIAAERGA